MKKNLFAITALLLAMYSAEAQRIQKFNPGSKGVLPEYIEFDATGAPLFNNKVASINAANEIEFLNGLELSSESRKFGERHVKIQQIVNGIPVEDAIYICHIKNGKLISQNGHWFGNTSSLGATPFIQERTALLNATRALGAQLYKWEIPGEENFIKIETGNPTASFYPKASLVYFNKAGIEQEPELRLAYKFDIYAQEPLMRKWVFVDAATGAVLGSEDQIHETNAAGTATTGYSGVQSITTDSYNGTFRLRETGRGNGIQTFNMRQGTNYNTAVDFTDADNNWNNVNNAKDQYATDAHWGAEKTYDFYKINFARNSIDNNGFLIKSYVHYSRNYFNAFWDGSRMTYGDGSATYGNKPLTSLDVCGHEITHGLTSFTAKLNYSYESGALNEGFSDIFGTAIEWYARPAKADWLIGGDFYTIRSMSNPKAYSQPKTYLKQYWYAGTADNGGVHTNSGVLNYWFYLLSAGGSGTNDNSFAFNVSAIGITKAQAIAYRTLTTYLVPTSNYAQARTYSIKSAEDLYGVGSNEALQTKNAWNAVGVGGGLSVAGKVATPITVNNNGLVSAEITAVYPNPSRQKINISFTDKVGGQKLIQLVNEQGNIILSAKYQAFKGANLFSTNFPVNATSGKYWVKINGLVSGSIIKE